MAAKGRIAKVLMVALLILGVMAPGIGNAKEFSMVRGVVTHVNGDVLTIEQKQYDITGVTVLDANGRTSARGDALRGKMAEIVLRNGVIVSVKVFRHVV